MSDSVETIDTPDPSKIFSSLLYPNLSDEDISVISEFFNHIDANKDGVITIDEIRRACAYDINHDGVISESEKDQTSRFWLRLYLNREDLSHQNQISLSDLLTFNNRTVGHTIRFRGALST